MYIYISPSPALLSRWFSVVLPPFGWDMFSRFCGKRHFHRCWRVWCFFQDDHPEISWNTPRMINFKREKPTLKTLHCIEGFQPTKPTGKKKKKVFFSVAPQRKKTNAYGVGDWYSPLKLWFENPLNNLLVVNCLGKIWLMKPRKRVSFGRFWKNHPTLRMMGS